MRSMPNLTDRDELARYGHVMAQKFYVQSNDAIYIRYRQQFDRPDNSIETLRELLNEMQNIAAIRL